MHESSKEANNQYLLEIGLEEMPAGMILPAVEQLKKAAEKSLESNRLQSAKVQPFSSPRRLALLISELPEKQEDRIEELKGPPASIARDQDGAWSKAALGFAKKNGIEPDSLELRNFDGRDYLYTAKNVQGASLKDILKQEAEIYYQTYNQVVQTVAKLSGTYGISLVIRYDSGPIDQTDRPSVIKGVNRNVVFQRDLDLTSLVLAELNGTTAGN